MAAPLSTARLQANSQCRISQRPLGPPQKMAAPASAVFERKRQWMAEKRPLLTDRTAELVRGVVEVLKKKSTWQAFTAASVSISMPAA